MTKEVIKSISFNQDEIFRGIIQLYCPQGFELDPTYSKGNFYKNIPQPKYKFDLKPQVKGVKKADCRNLPVVSNSVQSILFDPPFIAGVPTKSKNNKNSNIIFNRFGAYKSIEKHLWVMYKEALLEFYRILKNKGILIFKCQDTVSSGKQYLSHVKIINDATQIGFYPKDLFILLAKNRLISIKHKNQKHARKYHSYFIILEKR